ncbi:lytic transglycosylase [Sulfuricaulis limicola]|uniref:Lytic transglycosylase n=1 Tax=Sulfuricaulis limicola TaxID=1620215 RepID=A0A1B4XHV1_9GAMM|nr:murein transglycosylase domain-containing protein [Sulfuricaulis limicola]BAV34373.1 lytic transglycosylase [Sulfuricaulis limicola]
MARTRKIILGLCCAALVAGCASSGRKAPTLNQTLAVLTSPTTRSVASIARSDNAREAIKAGLKSRESVYKSNPYALVQDVKTIQRDYTNLVTLLTGRVSKTWGKKEVKLPSRVQYIKYTQNYMSRAVVDFDKGEVTVETVDDKDPNASLKNAIVTTLLTPNDPRAVDLFSDSAITLTSEKEPYLLGLVVDQNNKPVASPVEAEGFADHLLKTRAATREVDLDNGKKKALFVKFPMVSNFENKQAEKYSHLVTKFAEQYKISPSLVYAVIRTESNFNPFAVSSAPAYGLMQLVPGSGGREAYRKAKGQDETPSKQFLFDAENNIELGTAYLNVLTYSQLEPVANPVSREYCVISAYNTGPSNVLRTFSKDKVAAVNAINGLSPSAVYQKLRTGLPYEETRQYLYKVVNYRRQFVANAN